MTQLVDLIIQLFVSNDLRESITYSCIFVENEPRKDRDLVGVGPGSYTATLADKKQEPRYG